MAVYGCVRALVAAVVAVTVAVGDSGGPSASEAGSQARTITCLSASLLRDGLALVSSLLLCFS
jgi:hypothetical protein